MWIEGDFFKYIIGVILVLLMTLLLYYNLPIFYLILWFLAAIFLPILFSTLFYYILRPFVTYFSKWMPKFIAILLQYVIVGTFITLMLVIFIPEVSSVISSLSTDRVDTFKDHFKKIIGYITDYIPFSNLPYFEKLFIDNLPKINSYIYSFTINLLSAVAGIAVAIGLTPFILYYFLRDDNLFSRFILRFVPANYQEEAQSIMTDIDTALAGFITAQTTIASITGCFLLIGYVIIGLPYPLSLAIFGMIFYVIPFLGTFIAVIPALIVGISVGLSLTFKVLIVMLSAHLIEANLITPRLMSSNLKIHPLTIILLLLIGGSLFGILGLILITPAYAILKVIVWNIYKIFRLKYVMAKNQNNINASENLDNGA